MLHVAHRGAAGGLFDPASGGRFIEALAPVEGEAQVEKTLPNSFAGTDLARRLVALRRPELIVAGFQTHMVRAAPRCARRWITRYRVTLVASACATRDLPDLTGGPALAATDVHRAALAALHDRFATVILDESQLP
ncbi:isochorismatase family protein [Pseudomonas sp. KNUC1026]|uniref:isochorismatase family protein n=1 Tax=Pseudomonas sp. KNUC1026 TaxID=2893890 RepID=UPI001F462949|nr:isochorismatase family protein [Pseudomonas sp. KNUC1026]UFH50585.1 isochorismatase family protein [Pseudomonas sp. KNUC1026]